MKFSVVFGKSFVPDFGGIEDVLAGARQELGREGALRSGNGYPRLVIDVLRVDEVSTGIASTPSLSGSIPLARGSAVGVVARGLLEGGGDAAAAFDTGDMRRIERYASSPDPRTDATLREQAVRSAARAVGRAIARRALGDPEPEIEEL